METRIKMTKDFASYKAGQSVTLEANEAGMLVKMKTATTGDPTQDAIIQGDPDAVARVPSRKSFADFLSAVRRRDSKYLGYQYGSKFVLSSDMDEASMSLVEARKAQMSESSGATGGYVVPQEYASEIMANVAELSVLRPLLDSVGGVLPMASATLGVPTPDITTIQPAGVSPFFGGVQIYWTGEAQTRTESEPAFKQMELRAWELSAYLTTSRPLHDDSPALARWLIRMFSQAVAWFEDFAFIQGNGVAKPQGIIGANASVAVSRATGNAIKYADVSSMMAKLPPGSLDQAHWLASPTALTNLFQLTDGSNRAVEFHANAHRPGEPREYMLAGLPLHVSEKCPPLGTPGDLNLIDPRFYVIGERGEILISASEHVKLLTNQIVWRIVRRIDGQPLLDKPITLQDGTTQVSGLVVLH
jgi:HK97 family phage major capsid protein